MFIKSIAHHISNFIANQQNENKKKLHAIYLINEILFKNYNQDIITAAFKPYLGIILKAIYQLDDKDIKAQIHKLLTFWGDKKIFSLKTIGDNVTVATLPHVLVLRAVVSISLPSSHKIESNIIYKEQKCNNPKFFYYDEASDKKFIALKSKNKKFTISIRNHSSTTFIIPYLENKNLRLKEKNKHSLTSTLIQQYPIIDHFTCVQMKNLYSRITTIKLKNKPGVESRGM